MNEKIQKIVIHRLRVCQATFSFQNRPDKPSGGVINPKGVGGNAGGKKDKKRTKKVLIQLQTVKPNGVKSNG